MPAIAAVDNPCDPVPPVLLDCWVDVDVVSVAVPVFVPVFVAVVVGVVCVVVPVVEVAEVVDLDVFVADDVDDEVDDDVGVKNTDAALDESASRAGSNFSLGQPALSQGLALQQPMNGGWAAEHVHQVLDAVDEEQVCAGISL